MDRGEDKMGDVGVAAESEDGSFDVGIDSGNRVEFDAKLISAAPLLLVSSSPIVNPCNSSGGEVSVGVWVKSMMSMPGAACPDSLDTGTRFINRENVERLRLTVGWFYL